MFNKRFEEIKLKIDKLKEEKTAVILAHNYQLGEIQNIADYVGDSLELSMKVKDTDAEIIVFCGVKFMAETAAIICSEKTVLLPVLEAGCPMADMADLDSLKMLQKQHPDAVTVCYVNSTAEVKTACDICCTSANAVDIVRQIPDNEEIIFLPDCNLGRYVERKTCRKMILWPGYCPTHARITPENVIRRRNEQPDAIVIVHPECVSDVIDLADEVLSTGGMIKFLKTTQANKIIVGTESGIIHRFEKENPSKEFIPVSEQAVCPNMKMIRLEDVFYSLKNMRHIINIPSAIRENAFNPIEKMLNGTLN